MRLDSGQAGQRISKALKFAWYLCASILVLSLPTFSYLVPRVPEHRAVAVDEPDAPLRPVSRGRLTTSVSKGRPSKAAESAVPSRNTSATRAQAQSPLAQPPSPTRQEWISADDETPRISPDRLERRRSRPSSVEGDLSFGPEQIEAGLIDLQEGYERAFSSLFPEVFFGVRNPGNPFQEALDGTGPPAEGTNTGQPAGEEAQNPPPTPGESGSQPPGNTQPPGTGGSPSPDVVDTPGPKKDPAYTFLLIGALAGNQPSLVSRARLDGTGSFFVLENGARFSFFPGVLHSLLGFGVSDKILIADLNQDGLQDLVVATEAPAVGTAIQSYLQIGPGSFALSGSALLYLQGVRSMSLFDFTGDGKDELALALENQPNLFVYEHVGSEWAYREELALSFRPGLLMSSAVVAGIRSRVLYVLDENMQQVLSASDRQPRTFRPGSPVPFNRLSRLEVNLSGRENLVGEVLVFSLPDQIVLAERNSRGLRTFGAFDAGQRIPLVIIGDYAGIKSRQMLWVP